MAFFLESISPFDFLLNVDLDMKNNNPFTQMIKSLVILGDFVVLNIIIFLILAWYLPRDGWDENGRIAFFVVNNVGLVISQLFFSSVVFKRLVGAGDIVKRIICLSVCQTVLAYVILQVIDFDVPIERLQFIIGTAFFLTLFIKRLSERLLVKMYRAKGRNYRSVTFVGADPELLNVYEKMKQDPTLGYNVLGYYADGDLSGDEYAKEEGGEHKANNLSGSIIKLGSMRDFIEGLNHPEDLVLGDELYVCISRREKKTIRSISQMCDRKVIRFFYVPASVESLGLNLKREMMDDLEVFTTYENPLQNPFNKAIKRLFDIVFSLLFLIPTAIIFPFVFIIMKIQSPGPILFKQKRTGLDGKTFNCLKFRSMHVNADADKVQATKDDPRKYPFGNFMRKSNIDELPQFLNVLKGDMSIVGPRPHMLAHTEQYSELIDKYMVRHFVKPGVTGWAQVTGFRGETKELWQMEGRVKRDIWYIENWSIWLDIRIMWLTFKSIFIHDKNAY